MLTRAPALVRMEGEEVALSTSRKYFPRFPWAREVEIYVPANFRMALCPKIAQAWFYNGSTYTNVTQAISDRDTATNSSAALDTTKFLYVGFNLPMHNAASGPLEFYVDVGTVNAVNAAMVLEYSKNDDTWATISATDGTDSSGTLAVDGEVTYTAPTDWGVANVNGTIGLQWLRISSAAALTAGATILNLTLGPQNNNYGYFVAGTHSLVCDRLGGIILLVASGTPNADVTWLGYAGE